MELLKEWWPLIVTVVGLIVWITRLRSDVDTNKALAEQQATAAKAALAEHESDCEKRYADLHSTTKEIRQSQERNRSEARQEMQSLNGKLDDLMRLLISRGGHV